MIKNSNEFRFTYRGLTPLNQVEHVVHNGLGYAIGYYDDTDEVLLALAKELPHLYVFGTDEVPLYVITDNKDETLDGLRKFLPKKGFNHVKKKEHEESYQLKQIVVELQKLGFTAQESVHASQGMLDLANGISR